MLINNDEVMEGCYGLPTNELLQNKMGFVRRKGGEVGGGGA